MATPLGVGSLGYVALLVGNQEKYCQVKVMERKRNGTVVGAPGATAVDTFGEWVEGTIKRDDAAGIYEAGRCLICFHLVDRDAVHKAPLPKKEILYFDPQDSSRLPASRKLLALYHGN